MGERVRRDRLTRGARIVREHSDKKLHPSYKSTKGTVRCLFSFYREKNMNKGAYFMEKPGQSKNFFSILLILGEFFRKLFL